VKEALEWQAAGKLRNRSEWAVECLARTHQAALDAVRSGAAEAAARLPEEERVFGRDT